MSRSTQLPQAHSAKLLAIALICAVVMLIPTIAGSTADSAPLPSGINQLSATGDDVSFKLSVPAYDIQAGNVTAEGLESAINETGAPALPYYSTLIALPPGAEAVINVTAIDASPKPVAHVNPVPTVADQVALGRDVEKMEVTSLESYGLAYDRDAAIYSADSAFPTSSYTLSEPMYSRDVRVVRLNLYPLRYNPVQQSMSHTTLFEVDIQFEGTDFSQRSPLVGSAHQQHSVALSNHILNGQHVAGWRTTPASLASSATDFPQNIDMIKIEVNQDGIYELSYVDLLAAGMSVSTVDPLTFEMMYRGEPVAYEFVGNPNDGFNAGEKIRFFGWNYEIDYTGIDNSMIREERQYVVNNVFWLWAGGTPTTVSSGSNPTGYSPVNSIRTMVTGEVEYSFDGTRITDWDNQHNDADSYYWRRLSVQNPLRTVSMDIPEIDLVSGTDARVTFEFLSTESVLGHNVDVTIGSDTRSLNWDARRNINIARSFPMSEFVNGSNDFTLSATSIATSRKIYLNRISVDYDRLLNVSDDMFVFRHKPGGNHEFNLSGFGVSNPDKAFVWNITDPHNPVSIPLSAADISGTGTYTYRFGAQQNAYERFVAGNTNGALSPVNLSSYRATSIDPAAGGADWIAITHSSLMGQTNRLANYRASQSFVDTHVVDVEDIFNQYGYGLPLPSAIKTYLTQAIGNWSTAPSYVTIVGHATNNPRGHFCDTSSPEYYEYWCEPHLVPADLVYVDSHIGMVPSDFTYTTLIGNDLMPDLAIGRIPAKDVTELRAVVDKIERYESAQDAKEDWLSRVLFVSDDADFGGDFCSANLDVDNLVLPDEYDTEHLCLDDYLGAVDPEGAMRQVLFSQHINNSNQVPGIINYRGHGAVSDWAGGLINVTLDETILPGQFWGNFNHPVTILSADCLDGHFTWLGSNGEYAPAVGESILTHDDTMAGSVAHWSSSGLGFTFEHTVLHTNFYEALLDNGLRAIGDSVNYSKMAYIDWGGGSIAEVYSFILLGDPAMSLPTPMLPGLYLPVVLSGQ